MCVQQIKLILHINKLRDRNLLFILIEAEKALYKIQHSFIIKALKKPGIDKPYIIMIMAIYDKYM